ncbi:MBL fold metallo-hydrolase [Mycolicibacterium sp.]|uniref:MBL fold metallo-hydrolase n=1 Tax=Mycolicibacterium sp. TaxID=2320850 RepID=UPI0037CCB3D4
MTTSTPARIGAQRHPLAIGIIGGPTTVIDFAGLRLVTEPTFDAPRDYGAYRKEAGPAVRPEELGPVDAVLLSHDLHQDNFDHAGRDFARRAPLLLTGPQAAHRLGGNARGLRSFDATELRASGDAPPVRVSAVPAQHGPTDGERDEYGNINTEVTGFVLEGEGLPTVYVSGDNTSMVPVREIADRFPTVDIAILHIGAARVAAKNAGRPLTLTADRATAVAELLGASIVVPVHCEGWSLYSESLENVRSSFDDAGLSALLRYAPPGSWAVLGSERP